MGPWRLIAMCGAFALLSACDGAPSTSAPRPVDVDAQVGGQGGAGGEALAPDAAVGGAGGGPLGGAPMGGEPVGGDPVGGDIGGAGGAEPPPLPGPNELPRFSFPVHPDDRALIRGRLIIGVDHAPFASDTPTECTNYEGRAFPGCYAGHDGTDFPLDGGFAAMDAGSAQVIAAAGGEVIRVEDGNYDRCRADLTTYDVACDGFPMRANRVHIRHANGWVSWYLHFKKDSILVREGDMVPCGAVLGLIGSSGYSALPHVHLEIIDPDGDVWDPYGGPESQPESLWVEQRLDDRLPGNACDDAWGQIP